MSPSGRAQFVWPHPGNDRTEPNDSWEPPEPEQNSAPLPEFCLGILDPDAVDMLSLKGNYRQLHDSKLDSAGKRVWRRRDVNP